MIKDKGALPTQARFLNERSDVPPLAMKHLLSPEDLTLLKEYKELRVRLRDNLHQQSRGSQKCSIGLFQKEAAQLGIHLSDADYKILWNAFRAKRRQPGQEAAQVLILVQNEMKCDEDCDIYYEKAIRNLVPQVEKGKQKGVLRIGWAMSKLAKMLGARNGTMMRHLLSPMSRNDAFLKNDFFSMKSAMSQFSTAS